MRWEKQINIPQPRNNRQRGETYQLFVGGTTPTASVTFVKDLVGENYYEVQYAFDPEKRAISIDGRLALFVVQEKVVKTVTKYIEERIAEIESDLVLLKKLQADMK